MTPAQIVLAAVIFAVGCCVQSGVGFGANLIAAPLLVLVDPSFVPGPVVVGSAVLNLLVLRTTKRSLVDPTVKVAVAGQVVGTLIAGAVLSGLPQDALAILFAGMVLVAVALSGLGLHLRPTTPNLAGAGTASGFMGTVSGIGGPPIALAYLGLAPAALRATLARYFLAGNVVAIPTLVLAGRLGADEIGPCLVLIPAAVIGYLLSPPLARHLDGRTARPFVLGLSTLAAVAVVARTVA